MKRLRGEEFLMKVSRRIRYMDINSEQEEMWHELPLIIPSGIYIEPTNLCNFRCPYCPTGTPELIKHLHLPGGMMDTKLYRKIIQDLKDMVRQTGRKIKRIHLYKYGEPLLHRDFPYMVQLAKEAEIAESVETTTNGALLTDELAREIIEAGLDVIRISVEHVEDAYYELVSMGRITYEQIRKNVESLFSQKVQLSKPLHIHSKIIDTGLSEEQKNRFINDFSPISDSWNINKCEKWPPDGIDNLECFSKPDTVPMYEMPGRVQKRRIACTEPFTKIVINFNGSVSACCIDWSFNAIVGDVSTQHIRDIWYGEALKRFRIKQLKGERFGLSACFTCDYADNLPDIDEHRDKLLALLEMPKS